MPVGLRIINDRGYFQVADGYKGHSCIEKRVFVIPPNSTREFKFLYYGGPLTLFAVSTPHTFTCCPSSFDGNYWDVGLVSRNETSVPREVAVCIFVPGTLLSPTGYGLEVFDEWGGITFSSMYPPLKFLPGPTAGRKMGFVVGAFGVRFNTRENLKVWGEALKINGADLQISEVPIGDVTISGGHAQMHTKSQFYYIDLGGI